MLVGIIRKDGTLMSREDVLKEAFEKGHVDNYPFIILESMLRPYRPKGPTASMVAGGAFRRAILEKHIDYYANPANLIAMTRGTLVHGGVELIKTDRSGAVMREKRFFWKIPHYRITVSGQIDLYFPQTERLVDTKTTRVITANQNIPDYHMTQVATYKYLLEKNGYPVSTVGIIYISWSEIRYVETTWYENETIPAIEHPLMANQEFFEDTYFEGWSVISAGFKDKIVPPISFCTTAWCRNCNVRWACDQIKREGEVLEPGKFRQEDM